MIRNLDDMMYISDGHNPFRYGLYGRGGLGYKPLPYNMIGGMAYRNPDKPSELYDEHILRFKEEYPELHIDTLNQYLDAVINSDKIDEERKINELNKQLSDLEFEKEQNDTKGKYKDKELEKNINESLEIINNYFQQDENRELKALENSYFQPKTNEFYERNDEEAEKENPSKTIIGKTDKDTERGDKFEKDAFVYEEDTHLLYNIDKDKSTAYNSKELEPYTDEFIKYCLKKIGINKDLKDLSDTDKDKLIDKILQFIPVDIVKDNTIWELKSYGKNLTNEYKFGKQSLSITKMDKSVVYNPKINKPYFNVIFKYNKGGDEWRVKNLYTDEGIPLLKNSNFKYYWMFNNPDGIGYYNPLKNKNFEPEKDKKDKYYKFGWKDMEDIMSSKKINIPNKDIQVYPRRYSSKFNKIIKKYKNKNI
jgi:hypothetical protein